MALHDYFLDNQSGSAFRDDLNGALAAIQSNNSFNTTETDGLADETDVVAYQWWVDTLNSLLKIRNSANDDWVTVGDPSVTNLGLLTTTSAASTYMALAGGTFTGEVTLNESASLVFEGATADGFETTLAVTDPTADRTFTLPDATTTAAGLAVAQTFTKAQRGSITTLTSATTVTPDFAAANNFTLTLGHNITLANPSNLTAGQSGAIFLVQDSTGSRTASFGSYWDFQDGVAPTLTTTASAVDLLVYVVRSTTSIHAQLLSNFS